MLRLAAPLTALRPAYDAVVIGSGYGGGVAASRLARLGLKVGVLERGCELLPGQFPTRPLAAQAALQIDGPHGHVGSRSALFDLRIAGDVHALVGCGLGGTSLINANVCLQPESRVLADPIWPPAISGDDARLAAGYARAVAMLKPEPLPGASRPRKLDALGRSAQALGGAVERVPLHIAFKAGRNSAGVQQAACSECGDCMGGCNVGAKTTVHNTYLADAVAHGAELFTEARVRYVERRADTSWRIVFHGPEQETATVPVRAVTAEIVVLAAGTFGSTEILLRSRERGLVLSDRLGCGISTNADVIAFAANCAAAVNAVGVGAAPRRPRERPGPAVAGMIDLRGQATLSDGMVVVDAAVQSALAPFLPLLFGAERLVGKGGSRDLSEALAASGRTLESLVAGAYAGAVRNTLPLFAIAHDTPSGQLRLEDDRVTLVWPEASADPVFARIDATLAAMAKALGGTYVSNPAASRWLGSKLFTVHPLGGAVMAELPSHGVVDHKGRVFASKSGGAADHVHEGLYVLDGAAIPRSLGVHPLLTITALAERAMMLMADDLGRQLDTTTPTPALPGSDAAAVDPPPAGRRRFFAAFAGRS